MKTRGQQVIDPQERVRRLSIPEPNTGCWLWTGAIRTTNSGLTYGRMICGKRSDGTRRSIGAHQYAYEAFKGIRPAGTVVCHECDNPLCVNPEHLKAAPHSVNMQDAVRRGRVTPPQRWRGRTHCKRGHELSPANTYSAPDGSHECRECREARRKLPEPPAQTLTVEEEGR